MAFRYNIELSDSRWVKLTQAQNGTIEELEKAIRAHEIALMVRPTGFGKTHLMLQFAKRLGYNKVLYLYPTKVIKESIEASFHHLNDDGSIIPPYKESIVKDGEYIELDAGTQYAATEEEKKQCPELPLIEFCTYSKMLSNFNRAHRFMQDKPWEKISPSKQAQLDKEWDEKSEEEKSIIQKQWIEQRFSDIDLLILDEAHMTGAPGFLSYWKYIHELARTGNKNKRLHILGATATPLRTNKDIDIEDKIFYYVYGGEKMSAKIGDFGFEHCWDAGIFQRPYMIKGILDAELEREEIVKTLKDSKLSSTQSEDVLSRIDDCFSNILSASQVVAKGLTEVASHTIEDKKYIRILVFHSDSKDLVQTRGKINDAIRSAVVDGFGYTQFNDYYIVSQKETISKKESNDNSDLLDGSNISAVDLSKLGVESDKIHDQELLKRVDKELKDNPSLGDNRIDVIHCIDMLNMGYHVGQVTCVIIKRKTGSEIMYYQQIGRCISISKNIKPLIIDFANADAELYIRAVSSNRDPAVDRIQQFIKKCDKCKEQNDVINQLYSILNMSIDGEPLSLEMMDYWYHDRKSPIYYMYGASISLGKKETLGSFLGRLNEMLTESGEVIILDTDFCVNNKRISSTIINRYIKPQPELLEKILQKQKRVRV